MSSALPVCLPALLGTQPVILTATRPGSRVHVAASGVREQAHQRGVSRGARHLDAPNDVAGTGTDM